MKKMIVLLLMLTISIICFAEQMSTEELADQLKKSTVKIYGYFEEEDVMFNDEESWSGTGVLIEENNEEYIIATNLHVLGFWSIYWADATGAPEIIKYSLKVKMFDGKDAEIKRVMINKDLKDFALIFIGKEVGEYPKVKVNSNIPAQGAQVYAMGHPLGLNFTFTSGVLSGHRLFPSKLGVDCKFIQTDTPINSGNSGGPLVNSDGELIGINTQKVAKTGVEGLNFAIWINEIVQSILNDEFEEFPLSPPRKIGLFVEMMQSR